MGCFQTPTTSQRKNWAVGPLFGANETYWILMLYSHSASNEYQGWGEVMGFYVDRALGWYKKPPMSGRIVSSKVCRMERHQNQRVIDYRLLLDFVRRCPSVIWGLETLAARVSSSRLNYLVDGRH